MDSPTGNPDLQQPIVEPELKPVVSNLSAAETHTYKFKVVMPCGGCSGAINRVLQKAKEGKDPIDIESYKVSLGPEDPADSSKRLPGDVTVVTGKSVEYQTILNKIKGTGKTVVTGAADDVDQPI